MSGWHEPTVMVTRTSVLQDPYLQGPHNERSRGGATRVSSIHPAPDIHEHFTIHKGYGKLRISSRTISTTLSAL